MTRERGYEELSEQPPEIRTSGRNQGETGGQGPTDWVTNLDTPERTWKDPPREEAMIHEREPGRHKRRSMSKRKGRLGERPWPIRHTAMITLWRPPAVCALLK